MYSAGLCVGKAGDPFLVLRPKIWTSHAVDASRDLGERVRRGLSGGALFFVNNARLRGLLVQGSSFLWRLIPMPVESKNKKRFRVALQ